MHNLISNLRINQLAVKPFLITRSCIKHKELGKRLLGEGANLKFEWENSHEINCVAYGKVFAVAAAESCLIKNLHTHTMTNELCACACVYAGVTRRSYSQKLEPQDEKSIWQRAKFVGPKQRKKENQMKLIAAAFGHL